MHYKESQEVLQIIQRSDRILLSIHTSPDGDSVASNLAMYLALQQLGKHSVTVISPDPIPQNMKFMDPKNIIQITNINAIDFSNFDLFISLDAAQLMVLVNKLEEIHIPKNFPIVVIDHHKNNKKFGMINLLDTTAPSTCEILYNFFNDVGVTIEKDLADLLLAGIIDDTGCFKFPYTRASTFQIAYELINKGADKDCSILNLLFSVDLTVMQFWGKVLQLLKVDGESRCAYAAIPYDVYKNYAVPSATGDFATMFLNSVSETDFGMIITEKEPNVISLSLRTRTGFDVSQIAVAFKGGGHSSTAGAKFEATFEDGVQKVLSTARKYAKDYKKI